MPAAGFRGPRATATLRGRRHWPTGSGPLPPGVPINGDAMPGFGAGCPVAGFVPVASAQL